MREGTVLVRRRRRTGRSGVAVGVAVSAAVLSLALVASASAATTTVGRGGWQVLSSAHVTAGGRAISRPGYRASRWLHVTPDAAGAVGTEVEALLQNGRCKHVFYGTNMRRCFGYMGRVGAVTVPRFAVPWWFRTTFHAPNGGTRPVQLIVNGVVGEADVWLDGHELATHRVVQGDFTRFEFDISKLVRPGTNGLALRVYPNDPNKMFTLDDVDWNQIPPDNNTGIQFPVQLDTAGPVSIADAHVLQHDNRHVTRARLTFVATVANDTRSPQAATVQARLRVPGVAAPTVLSRQITLAPSASGVVRIPLTVAHPHVWWPYQMGGHPLYGLTMAVDAGGARSDAQSETFGIRTISSRLVGPSRLAPHGSRQFLVNGRPFMFRGGGWSENLFLHYSAANTTAQIAMIKSLGLNGIRTEGKQLPGNFYEQLDRAGILVDAGYQCCDAWQLQDSKLTSRHDLSIVALSAKTIAENLRNHPSILNFSWSDNNPTPAQERVSVAAFRHAGFQEPLIASAEYKRARGLGWSGEKEGPYAWVPPGYWYDTSHIDPSDSTRTNVGGAWAFDSEAGSGDTIPTLSSLRSFETPRELRQLWTEPDANQYHLNYEHGLPGPDNGGYAFGTVHDLNAAIAARYGRWKSLAGYVEEAQLQNYETQRAQFEAYIDHSTRRRAPSTGLVYWQLNKGWPTLLWDLYNADFNEAGSFFGAQEANRPLHVLYAYGNGDVAVDDLAARGRDALSVQARVFDVAGRLLSDRTVHGISVGSERVDTDVMHPRVPAATRPPERARTYFVELLLRDGRRLVDRNVYWLSTQHDVVNWPKTIGQPEASMIRYASLRQLHELARGRIAVRARTRVEHGADGANRVTDVTITNTSHRHAAAFFIRADIDKGAAAGRPVLWSGNDVTLWPGESQTVAATYRAAGSIPVVGVSGFNVPARRLHASVR
jgi:exo-1,4-beta-D-glucosaminidase